jgi:hypothetical protein
MFVPVVFCLHMVLICLGTFSGESHIKADITSVRHTATCYWHTITRVRHTMQLWLVHTECACSSAGTLSGLVKQHQIHACAFLLFCSPRM